MKTILIALFLTSCSHVNTDSRDYYRLKEDSYKHKISPILSTETKRLVYDANPSKKRLEHGKKLYKETCFQCHGPLGLGNGPLSKNLDPKPANLERLVKEVPHFELHLNISNWSGRMPGWKERNFSQSDLADIGLYLKNLHRD